MTKTNVETLKTKCFLSDYPRKWNDYLIYRYIYIYIYILRNEEMPTNYK